MKGARGSAGIRSGDREVKGPGDGHGHVALAAAYWSRGQIKELCGIHLKKKKRQCFNMERV